MRQLSPLVRFALGVRKLLASTALTHRLGSSRNRRDGSEVCHSQAVFLDGELQLVDGGLPLRPFFVERTGAKFPNSIFEATRRHERRHMTSGGSIKMPQTPSVLDTLHTV